MQEAGESTVLELTFTVADGVDEQLMLTGRRGAGDDQGPGSIDAHRLGQFVGTVDVIGDLGRVPFHCPGHDPSVPAHSHLAEAS